MRSSVFPGALLTTVLITLVAFVVAETTTAGSGAQSPAPVWTEPSLPSAPAARMGHTAIYDPDAEGLVIFGGTGEVSPYFNDVWVLASAPALSWSQISPTGTSPAGRYSHMAVYDSANRRMIIVGGVGDGSYRNDLWSLSLSGAPVWTQLSPAGNLPSLLYASAIYDPFNQRVIVFGGTPNSTAAAARNDVWSLSLTGPLAWTQLSPAGTPPSGRYGHTAIYDPVKRQMLIYGGQTPGLANDLWFLSLSGAPLWTQFSPAGTPPKVYYGHTAVYDSANRQMVVFGGNTGANPSNRTDPRPVFSNGLWALGPLSGSSCAATPTPVPASPTTVPISGSLNRALYLPIVANSWCKP